MTRQCEEEFVCGRDRHERNRLSSSHWAGTSFASLLAFLGTTISPCRQSFGIVLCYLLFDGKRGRKAGSGIDVWAENALESIQHVVVGAWRSLVAHLPWAQGVGGSNPLAPTKSFQSFGLYPAALGFHNGVPKFSLDSRRLKLRPCETLDHGRLSLAILRM